MTLQSFIDTHNLGFTHAKTDANPHMPDFEGDHYIVGFYRGDDLFTLHYSVQNADEQKIPPTPEEVMEVLRVEAGVFNLAPEGYTPEDPGTIALWLASKAQNERLKAFLSPELYDALLATEEDD